MTEKIKLRFTKRQINLLISLIFAILLSIGAKYVPEEYRTTHNEEETIDTVTSVISSEEYEEGEEESKEENVSSDTVTVVRVIDGDTIVVREEGKEVKVRLIGVDTPESVDTRTKVQCFGKEAAAFTTKLLSGEQVRLEPDATQTDTDIYGRLLRYVYIADGQLVNDRLIREGYAHEYTYKIPYQKQVQFREAQKEAREQRRGLWSKEVCP